MLSSSICSSAARCLIVEVISCSVLQPATIHSLDHMQPTCVAAPQAQSGGRLQGMVPAAAAPKHVDYNGVPALQSGFLE